ncbi:MAG: mechanosensitive ion channel domain-containing protein [Reichenbachiella sp.]|uniref:mechanosensitive ion channel family protein n=1 Tax=Reichenbachiella sp. TaxID=2184521 RepID=UPI0032640CF6
MTLEELMPQILNLIFSYGPKLVGAIIILIIGFWVVKALSGGFRRLLEAREIDASLKPFLVSLVSMLLKVILVISVLTTMGVEMTSLIAILGAAGLAVGMALSGTLQNFAGGVMILIFRPFKVGDFIDAQGYNGTVHAIQIFNTILKTPDNKTIIIPNGGLSTGSMTNFSSEPKRRVDWTFGIAYGDDVDNAKAVIKMLADADTRIHKDPEVFIAVSALADSSVNIVVRAWANAEDYWGVFFDMNENIYKTFAKKGISIPFPQMDVHMHKD